MKRLAFSVAFVVLSSLFTSGSKAQPLGEDKSQMPPAIIRADKFGDALPPGATARLGALRLRHGSSILVAAYAPDGKTLVSFGADQCIRFWDPASGKELQRWALKLDTLWYFGKHTLAFSDNGQILAVGSNRSIALLPAHVGGKPRYLREQDEDVYGLVFAPEDKFLAVHGAGSAVSLLDPASGNERRRLSAHTGSVRAAAFSPDGLTLATGSDDHSFRLWRVNDGKELLKVNTGNLVTARLAFALDGRTLSWTDERGHVHVWDIVAQREVDSFLVCNGQPFDDMPIGTLRFTADGSLQAWGTDPPTLCLWQLNKRLQRRVFEHLLGKAPYGRLAPDGKCAVCWAENSPVLRLMDVQTGREQELCQGHWRPVRSITVASGNELIATSAVDDTVRLWDLRTSQELRRWRAPGIGSPHVAFAPDGKVLASCARDGENWLGTIRLWDVATGREQRQFLTEANRYLTFSRDGTLLFSAGRCGVEAWDPARGKLIRRMEEVPEASKPPLQIDEIAPFLYWEAIDLAATPDGKFAATVVEQARSERLYLWETSTGKRVNSWSEKGLRAPIAFSPDGHILAAVKNPRAHTRDYDVILWEVATGKEYSRIPLKEQGCESLAFSPDGKLLAFGSQFDGTVCLWSIADGKEIGRLQGPRGSVMVAFARDATALISGHEDATLLVWNLRDLASSATK